MNKVEPRFKVNDHVRRRGDNAVGRITRATVTHEWVIYVVCFEGNVERHLTEQSLTAADNETRFDGKGK